MHILSCKQNNLDDMTRFDNALDDNALDAGTYSYAFISNFPSNDKLFIESIFKEIEIKTESLHFVPETQWSEADIRVDFNKNISTTYVGKDIFLLPNDSWTTNIGKGYSESHREAIRITIGRLILGVASDGSFDWDAIHEKYGKAL